MVPVSVENSQVHPVEVDEMEAAQAVHHSAAHLPHRSLPVHVSRSYQPEALGSVNNTGSIF